MLAIATEQTGILQGEVRYEVKRFQTGPHVFKRRKYL